MSLQHAEFTSIHLGTEQWRFGPRRLPSEAVVIVARARSVVEEFRYHRREKGPHDADAQSSSPGSLPSKSDRGSTRTSRWLERLLLMLIKQGPHRLLQETPPSYDVASFSPWNR